VSDYWLAVKYLKILAEEDNNDEAQYYLGLMYVDGLGVSADPYEGFKWIMKAAEQENTDAMYQISDMYRYGIGTAKDTVKANEWEEDADEIEWGWMYYWF
jgi:TPR repeat protein